MHVTFINLVKLTFRAAEFAMEEPEPCGAVEDICPEGSICMKGWEGPNSGQNIKQPEYVNVLHLLISIDRHNKF